MSHAVCLACGLERGDRVGALGRNSDAYIFLWLGCTRAGLIHVPINYALTGGELEFILRQCGARALLYQPSLRETAIAACERTGITLTGTLDGASEIDVLEAATDPRWGAPGDPAPDEAGRDDDLVQLLYTAGTTGRSKGAMMTHRAFLAHYASCIVAFGYTPEDRSLGGATALSLGADALFRDAVLAVWRASTISSRRPSRRSCSS